MPIPGYRLKRKVILIGEMSLDGAQQDNGQHGGAHGHVEPVEAGQQEESGTVYAGVQGQAQFMVGVDVLAGL